MEGIWWNKVKIVSCFNSRYQYVNNTAYELISKSNNLSIIKSTNQELYKEKIDILISNKWIVSSKMEHVSYPDLENKSVWVNISLYQVPSRMKIIEAQSTGQCLNINVKFQNLNLSHTLNICKCLHLFLIQCTIILINNRHSV